MRLILTATLFAALSLPAQAFDWPWQEEREVRYGYCKGFVVAGLAAIAQTESAAMQHAMRHVRHAPPS